jgi:creatinine amidohydrolase
VSAPRPWLLTETSWRSARDTRYDVAVLPWGATEAHNYHLPYGTDTIETERVAAASARIAWEAGARVVVLPAVPFGVNTGQLDIPLCLNMNPGTQAAVLGDVTASVERAGVGKLVILNGHGGNDFRQMIRELQPRTKLFLSTVNWYACLDPKPFFEEPGDHAGELETSMMLHLAGDLVRPLADAGPGKARRFKVKGLREGWAWAPRQWTQVTADTGVGDPRCATASKGERFFQAVTARIGEFLAELAAADPDNLYE